MSAKINKNFVVLFLGESSTPENKYITILEKHDINARSVPVLSFNFINRENLQKCIFNPDFYSGIIFTSKRTVSAVSSTIDLRNDAGIDQWKTNVNFSVGKATADFALSELNLETHGSESGNSEMLCQYIIDKLGKSVKPLLYPCSSIRKDTILNTLTKNDITVEEVVCYETGANKDLERLWQNLISEHGLPEILVFFSPSGVHSCIELVRLAYSGLELPKFIAIGPSTQKSLLEQNVACKVAEKPTPESVLEVVRDMLST